MDIVLFVLSIIFFAISLGLLVFKKDTNDNFNTQIEQLQKEKEKAEAANRAKSDFISNMSLEIRTQLNSIVGFSEDIQSHKENADSKIVEDAEYVLEASKKLLEIVDSILDINKIESNKVEIKEEKYNLKEVLESLSDMNVKDKDVQLKVNFPSNIPYELLGDKTHLKEILNHLVTNAMNHTEQGDIELEVLCENEEDICHLTFNMHKGKEELSNSRDIELTLTKALVEMMNGKYCNEGEKIVVEIPQKICNQVTQKDTIEINITPEEEQEDQIQIEVPKAFGYAGKKVLIVDDNELNIKVARRALDGFEFKIDECTNGQECLDKIINGNEYDLILMDIMMPNMSGEEAMEKLKENPDFKIPTIALTADVDTGAKEKYLEEGFVDYIAKPFNKEQIEEKLEIVFNKPDIEESSIEIANIIANEKEEETTEVIEEIDSSIEDIVEEKEAPEEETEVLEEVEELFPEDDKEA